MENKINQILEGTSFEKTLAEKAKDGWRYAEKEALTITKFSSEAKFEEISVRSEADIIKKYSENGKYDVELVLDTNTQRIQDFRKILTPEEFEDLLKNLSDRDRNYFVFIRLKKKD